MRRLVAGVTVAIALTVAAWAIHLQAFSYGYAANAGVAVISTIGCVGFEYRGNVGFFGGPDAADCDI